MFPFYQVNIYVSYMLLMLLQLLLQLLLLLLAQRDGPEERLGRGQALALGRVQQQG